MEEYKYAIDRVSDFNETVGCNVHVQLIRLILPLIDNWLIFKNKTTKRGIWTSKLQFPFIEMKKFKIKNLNQFQEIIWSTADYSEVCSAIANSIGISLTFAALINISLSHGSQLRIDASTS